MRRVVTVPVLRDNYAYLVIDEATREAVVVDPGEAAPIEAAIAREGITLVGIACTHHHHDHVEGIEGLLERRGPLPVLGSRHDHDEKRIPHQSIALDDGARTSLAGLEATVLHVPGHTLGAIAYVTALGVFTGDTLFLGGAGRVFEGTMPMMRASLMRLASLAPETPIYCGHEYTRKNLEFAQHVEPANDTVRARLAALTEPSVPAPLSLELATNPFLRTDAAAVIAFAERAGAGRDADAVFTAVREAKNRF